MNQLKKTFSLLLTLFLIWQIIGLIGAYIALSGNPLEIGHLLKDSGLNFKEINLSTSDNLKIKASFHSSSQRDTAVIILAGIRGNRGACLKHAAYYKQRGYGVLLIDLRATGESEGEFLSFGFHEKQELLAGIDYLNKEGYTKIGAHGMSMGAATIVYSFAEKTDYAFVILESVYDNIQQAFYNRLPIVPLDNFIFKPLHFWTYQLADIQFNQLAPDQLIHLYQGPLLIIAGDREEKVKPEETQRMYDLSTSLQKQLYWIKGAKHFNFLKHYPMQTKEAFDNFLNG